MKSDKYYIYFAIVIKSWKRFTTIYKLFFYFYWPKDTDENLKHEIEFIIKKQ